MPGGARAVQRTLCRALGLDVRLPFRQKVVCYRVHGDGTVEHLRGLLMLPSQSFSACFFGLVTETYEGTLALILTLALTIRWPLLTDLVVSPLQFFSACVFGHVSDTYGRRPLLLYGTLISVFGTLLFGLARSVEFALAVRFTMVRMTRLPAYQRFRRPCFSHSRTTSLPQ